MSSPRDFHSLGSVSKLLHTVSFLLNIQVLYGPTARLPARRRRAGNFHRSAWESASLCTLPQLPAYPVLVASEAAPSTLGTELREKGRLIHINPSNRKRSGKTRIEIFRYGELDATLTMAVNDGMLLHARFTNIV